MFYFMDKFVTLTCADRLGLYNYTLDALLVQKAAIVFRPSPCDVLGVFLCCQDDSDDLRRLRSECKYKLVEQWEIGCQSITATACMNSFPSGLILLTGSDKSLILWDVVAGMPFTPCTLRITIASDVAVVVRPPCPSCGLCF